MSTIQVSFSQFNSEPIIEYYNANKPTEWQPIHILNRIEGGFQVKISDYDTIHADVNYKIRQLRWHKKQLVVPMGMYGLRNEEINLLYQAFLSVHNTEEVSLL